jgi:hypothetical protein
MIGWSARRKQPFDRHGDIGSTRSGRTFRDWTNISAANHELAGAQSALRAKWISSTAERGGPAGVWSFTPHRACATRSQSRLLEWDRRIH